MLHSLLEDLRLAAAEGRGLCSTWPNKEQQRQFDADILFLQETRLASLAEIHAVKREWRHGPSFWSLAAEPYSGVAVLFKTDMVTCRRVIEVEIGRCMVLDAIVRGQDLRLINIYGPQTKWDRKCLLTKIKPFLFTARPVVFGGDGIWRMNSALLEEEGVRQSFEDFFQAQT
ncbi:uncharacterized protein PAF06_011142 [Gastrophryne carolinensis]